MSHVDIIIVKVKSLPALEKACERLGGQFKWNQTHFAWWGHSVGDHPIPKGFTEKEMGHCLHAIHFKDCKYEVGVVQDKEDPNCYAMLGDFWQSGGLSKAVGEGGWKLTQAYTMEQAQETARNTCQRYEEEILPDRRRTVVYLN
jgi:hypothetical protein